MTRGPAGGGLSGRAAWNLIDQVVSSLSNAAVAILVARTVSPTEFGWFAAALTTTLLVLSLVRALVCYPLMITSGGLDEAGLRAAGRSAAGASVLIGVSVGLLLGLVGAAIGGSAGASIAAAGLVLPVILLQDVLRFVALVRGRPQEAALSDGLWLVALLVVLTALERADVDTAWGYVVGWGAGAALAAGVAATRLRWLPRLRGARAWAWERRSTSGWLLAEVTAAFGSAQVVVLLVTAVAGAVAGGAWRGVQTLLGPVNVLGMAARTFIIPELVRRPDLSAARRVRAALALSGLLVVANLVYGGILLALPTAVGEQLLGETWAGARDYLPALTIWSAAVAASFGPLTVLQTVGRARSAAKVSFVLCPLLLGGAGIGLLLGGGLGAAYGVMLAQLAVIPLWWRALQRGATQLPSDPAPADSAAGGA